MEVAEEGAASGRTPFALLATDIDGTLTRQEVQVTPRNARAIRDLVAAGIPVVLCTGRSEIASLPIAHRLGLSTPLVVFNGARVVDPVTESVLFEARVAGRDLATALLLADHYGDAFFAYVEDRVYADTAAVAANPLLPSYLFTMDRPLVPVRDLGGRLRAGVVPPPNKLTVLGTPVNMSQLARVAEELSLNVHLAQPIAVEILPRGVSKASGLALVARAYGVAREAVIAVGNAGNDIAMLQWAGLGVAISDAPLHVQAAAAAICPPPEEGALAAVAERWLLPPSRKVRAAR